MATPASSTATFAAQVAGITGAQAFGRIPEPIAAISGVLLLEELVLQGLVLQGLVLQGLGVLVRQGAVAG